MESEGRSGTRRRITATTWSEKRARDERGWRHSTGTGRVSELRNDASLVKCFIQRVKSGSSVTVGSLGRCGEFAFQSERQACGTAGTQIHPRAAQCNSGRASVLRSAFARLLRLLSRLDLQSRWPVVGGSVVDGSEHQQQSHQPSAHTVLSVPLQLVL